MANTYNVNEDERVIANTEAKNDELKASNTLYDDMIANSDGYYQAQIDASKDWADKQSQLQQENTDFLLEQIGQQKEQANKDYQKEQSGAYVDWQKQSNQFSANAEQMASSGLSNTGYSESSKVSMYNTYQNRVATARESYNKAVLNYDNSMKDAILQNNTALATIAYQALQQQLELALQGFQYKNTLILEQQAQQQAIQDRYHNYYQDIVTQINQEKAYEESIRQYEKDYLYKAERDKIADQQWAEEQKSKNDQWQKEYDLTVEQFRKDESGGGNTTGGGHISNGSNLTAGVSDKLIPVLNYNKKIITDYYSGTIAENVGGYGYMGKDKNGVAYQPKGIYVTNGKGKTEAVKLSRYGKTAGQIFGKEFTNSSGVNVSNQNIWKAKTSDGRTYYYIWNGTKNKYEQVLLS